jgi:hypothetical protein
MTQTIDHIKDRAPEAGDPFNRAMVAYFTECQENGVFYQQPASYSGVREYDGKKYVVLENIHGPLAVYLVGPDGDLEEVTEDSGRWPAALREEHPDPPMWLAAWALTREEAGDDFFSITVSREGMDPDGPIDQFDGDVGSGKYDFDAAAADALLAANGYRRVGPWVEGSMDGQEQHNKYAITDGRSCEVVRVSED